MASIFVQDPGLALVVTTCPRRPQAYKKANNGQALPWETILFLPFLFLNKPFAGTPRHAYKMFRTNIRRLRRANTK